MTGFILIYQRINHDGIWLLTGYNSIIDAEHVIRLKGRSCRSIVYVFDFDLSNTIKQLAIKVYCSVTDDSYKKRGDR